MSELTPGRLSEIRSLAPTADPIDCWAAVQDLLREREHLIKASADVAEELAQWTGELAR
ncbi:hypothetical protein [Streptomyces sp. IB2014 016-6]|uniref:hypothetical protein n=1 Tax=Streptomyces sp. IB2014 016-6 TaxID=2517818 RepID=UPI00164FB253|nr:hypothetical protein [Streptomyces sp. IB2014 016-6]